MISTLNEFDYGTCRIRDLKVVATRPEGLVKGKPSKSVVQYLDINGRKVLPSNRFWTSLQCRFGFSNNIFRYFDHAEVFERVASRNANDTIRYCVEKNKPTGIETMLAVTNPASVAMDHDSLISLFNRYKVESLTYSNGIVQSTHKPRNEMGAFKIGGDEFNNQFIIDTPIDGFGHPSVYLSLMRIICANGAIGYDKAFRSDLAIGKNSEEMKLSLSRALDGFNNEEGFAAIRDRYENAQRSWASVHEAQRLYKLLATLATRGQLVKQGRENVRLTDGSIQTVETSLPIFDAFHKMSGDLSRLYGLANLETLSVKRQRTLPAACKVYDLLNFVTEVATHKATTVGNRVLQGFVGELLAKEYDLEGTADEFTEWRDFFIDSSRKSAVLAN